MENVRHDFEGWDPIIDEMRERLKPFDVCITAMKMKWGTFTVFYRVNGSESDKDAVRRIIEEAENTSTRTCQYCGSPAKEEFINGWHYILCDTCRKKKK